MAITLNHTIVPAHDKEASARFFADIFGLTYEGPMGHFAPVRVNDALTLDFDNRERFESHHYAFHVNDAEFDAMFDRIKATGIAYGSGPRSLEDGQINTRRGGRGVYFRDPNGHVLELLTRTWRGFYHRVRGFVLGPASTGAPHPWPSPTGRGS
jgi:catechol 2,3-dioxygenase-like lactoylglutathione lyase family enzyme